MNNILHRIPRSLIIIREASNNLLGTHLLDHQPFEIPLNIPMDVPTTLVRATIMPPASCLPVHLQAIPLHLRHPCPQVILVSLLLPQQLMVTIIIRIIPPLLRQLPSCLLPFLPQSCIHTFIPLLYRLMLPLQEEIT